MMRTGPAFMDAALPATADPLVVDETAFRAFYDRTARLVWAYLYRGTRDAALADDLLQESYYRWLRARGPFESDTHRERYLFRIAANLLADTRRRRTPVNVPLALDEIPSEVREDTAFERRADLERAMATLSPRDRDMLWLAYADGASHEEIAVHLGVGRPSVKVMLFRARQRLASRLREAAALLQHVRRRR
jgi:RNA polymerase sigma-70 factor (ECF subfamily)